MPFLLVEVDDPGPYIMRKHIVNNYIALLSNCERESIDPPSGNWLEQLMLVGQWKDSQNSFNNGLVWLKKCKHMILINSSFLKYLV